MLTLEDAYGYTALCVLVVLVLGALELHRLTTVRAQSYVGVAIVVHKDQAILSLWSNVYYLRGHTRSLPDESSPNMLALHTWDKIRLEHARTCYSVSNR